MAISMKSVKLKTNQVSEQDIAIIGLSCKFASADNKEEFWQMLRRGEDCIRKFPEERERVANEFLQYQSKVAKDSEFYDAGFLNEIDKFDNDVFPISNAEISLMSPAQRNFLQTAWAAMEDAGYGSTRSYGTKTGVFLGHSTDFGVPYKDIIDIMNEELASISISGNLNGIVASRISYLNNWSGPAVDVDTACSSSLTALHLACQSLRAKECEMAIVGAVKIDLVPVDSVKKREDEIGIGSKDGKTRTFDKDSDGTGIGEGVAAIVLKPLTQALKDNDNICAVIKGSAMNHDGKSANLTAPNAVAQEEVIVKALKTAGVKPDSISYIEAHGTGTKLGDPIEIKGITNAYRKFTDKKQFCGIGSVKSNIGHTDNAAGMAGLIKLILCLQNKKLVPSIHYHSPNENINFEASPVYVNTTYHDWEAKGGQRRCAVSGFGLSGTNCHVILEEAPQKTKITEEGINPQLLTISASSKKRLMEYVWRYQNYLFNHADIRPVDLCYTANTGREQYGCRLAILFHNIEELKNQLELAVIHDFEALEANGIYYGFHRVVGDSQKTKQKDEITVSQKNAYTKQVASLISNSDSFEKHKLEQLAEQYCQGATVDWKGFYKKCNDTYYKLELPTYPYKKKKFWVENKAKEKKEQIQYGLHTIDHPLLQRIVAESYDRITYESHFDSEKDWVLQQYKVGEKTVLPDSIYVEMIVAAIKESFGGKEVVLRNLQYMKPLVITSGTSIDIQTIVSQEEDTILYTIASRDSETGMNQILCKGQAYVDGSSIRKQVSLKEQHLGENQVLTQLNIPKEYQSQMETYTVAPVLMDMAIHQLLSKDDDEIYIMDGCQSISVYEKLPEKVTCYMEWKSIQNDDLITLNLTFLDEQGTVLVEANQCILRTCLRSVFESNETYYTMAWQEKKQDVIGTSSEDTCYIIAESKESDVSSLTNQIHAAHIIHLNEDDITLEQLESKLKPLSGYGRYHILNFLNYSDSIGTNQQEEKRFNEAITKILNLLVAIENLNRSAKIILSELGYHGVAIDEKSESCNPYSNAYHTFVNGLTNEFAHLTVKSVDVDSQTSQLTIVNELLNIDGQHLVVYRNNERHLPRLRELTLSKRKSFVLKENGVYVITGGLGKAGLLIGSWLTKQQKIKLVLVDQCDLCDRTLWDTIQDKKENVTQINKMEAIQQMEHLGTQVFMYRANVGDDTEFANVMKKIENEQGGIHGIVHAVGETESTSILSKSKLEIEQVLKPKVRGAITLGTVAKDNDVDFLLFVTSASSLITVRGAVDDKAADSFLETYAWQLSKQGVHATTIQWPTWYNESNDMEQSIVFDAIPDSELEHSLELILSADKWNVIVGNIDYHSYNEYRYDTLFELEGHQKREYQRFLRTAKQEPKKETHELYEVRMVGDDHFTEEEKKLGKVIGNVLGIKEVNVYHTFMELGGNSIIGVKAEMDLAEHGYTITTKELFSDLTIRQLANGDEVVEVVTEELVKEEVVEQQGTVLEGIVPFTDLMYRGCFYSALIPVLIREQRNYMNLLTNAVMVFQFKEPGNAATFTIDYLERCNFEESMEQLNIRLNKKLYSNDVIADIKQSIDRGLAVIVSADCYYSSIRPDVYQKEHCAHAILVYGYDDENELLYINEHKNADSRLYESRTCSYQDMKDSYEGFLKEYPDFDIINSSIFKTVTKDRSDNPTYFEIEPIGTSDSLNQAVIQKNYIDFMKKNQQEIADSWSVLKTMIDSFMETVLIEEKLADKCSDMITSMNMIINSRSLLQYQYRYLWSEGDSIRMIINNVVDSWESARVCLLKYYYSQNYRSKWVDKINYLFQKVLENEEKLIQVQREEI